MALSLNLGLLLILYTVGRTPGAGIRSSQGRCLYTGQHKHRINASSRIRTHDLSLRAYEDSCWLTSATTVIHTRNVYHTNWREELRLNVDRLATWRGTYWTSWSAECERRRQVLASPCPGLNLRRCLREANRPGKLRVVAPEGRSGSPLYYNRNNNTNNSNNANNIVNNTTTTTTTTNNNNNNNNNSNNNVSTNYASVKIN
jgi:hypothetical protein